MIIHFQTNICIHWYFLHALQLWLRLFKYTEPPSLTVEYIAIRHCSSLKETYSVHDLLWLNEKLSLFSLIVIVNIDSNHLSGIFTLGGHKIEVRLQLVTMRTRGAVSVESIVLRLGRGLVGLARQGVCASFMWPSISRSLQGPSVCIVTSSLWVVTVGRLSWMLWMVTLLSSHWFGSQRHGWSRRSIRVGDWAWLLFLSFKCLKSVVSVSCWIILPGWIWN